MRARKKISRWVRAWVAIEARGIPTRALLAFSLFATVLIQSMDSLAAARLEAPAPPTPNTCASCSCCRATVQLEPVAPDVHLLLDVSMTLHDGPWEDAKTAALALRGNNNQVRSMHLFGHGGRATCKDRPLRQFENAEEADSARAHADQLDDRNKTPVIFAITSLISTLTLAPSTPTVIVLLSDLQDDCNVAPKKLAQVHSQLANVHLLFVPFGDAINEIGKQDCLEPGKRKGLCKYARALKLDQGRIVREAAPVDGVTKAVNRASCLFRVPPDTGWDPGKQFTVFKTGDPAHRFKATALGDLIEIDADQCEHARDGLLSMDYSRCEPSSGGDPGCVWELVNPTEPTRPPSWGHVKTCKRTGGILDDSTCSEAVVQTVITVIENDAGCLGGKRIKTCVADANVPSTCASPQPDGFTTGEYCAPVTNPSGGQGTNGVSGRDGLDAPPTPSIVFFPYNTTASESSTPLDGMSVSVPGDISMARGRTTIAFARDRAGVVGVSVGVRPFRALWAAARPGRRDKAAASGDQKGGASENGGDPGEDPNLFYTKHVERKAARAFLGFLDSIEASVAAVSRSRVGVETSDAYSVALAADLFEAWRGKVSEDKSKAEGYDAQDWYKRESGPVGSAAARVAACTITYYEKHKDAPPSEKSLLKEASKCRALQDRVLAGLSVATDLFELAQSPGRPERTRVSQVHPKLAIRVRAPLVRDEKVFPDFFSATLQTGIDHYNEKFKSLQTARRGTGRSSADLSLRIDMNLRVVAFKAEAGAHYHYASKAAPSLVGERFFGTLGGGIDIILPWSVTISPSLRGSVYNGQREMRAFVGVGVSGVNLRDRYPGIVAFTERALGRALVTRHAIDR